MIIIAKGKFSQPRRRQDDEELTSVYQRSVPAAHPQDPAITEHDPSLDETMYMPQGFVPGQENAPAQHPSANLQETISFEETVFLQETTVQPQERVPYRGNYPQNDYDEDDYDEEDEDEPVPVRRSGKKNNSRKVLLVSICAVTVLLLIAIIAGILIFVNANKDDGLILNNVTVAGVNIGGMTPEEAATAIHRVTDLTFSNENMVITLPDTILELTPEKTGAKLDVAAVVEAAYNYGRTGTAEENKQAKADSLVRNHTIALLPYLNLDQDYIRQELEAYGEYFNSDYEKSSFTLEGNMPELTGDKFDPNAPCQTLVLKPGKPGRYVDIDKIFNDILDAYSLNTFEVETNMTDEEQTPEALDLDAIFEMLHTDPIDAAMDMESFDVTGETYGYTFDLENAKELLSQTEYGSTLEISMEYVKPQILSSDLEGKLFRDTLASFETPHTNDSNRNTNLQLACEAINGYILMPGDTFDYNKVLGERTEERGYKPAGALMSGTSTTEVGGGICQVSSTLYYCTLISDMEIVTRRSHSLPSTYMPMMGVDATVSWGGPNFRFKNNTDYPVQIKAEVSGGYVKVTLLGTDDKDYYVKMESKIVEVQNPETVYEEYTAAEAKAKGVKAGVKQQPVTGYTVYSYKCKYSKETDEMISRDYEATSNYVKKDKIVIKIVEEATEPTTQPTEATTPPATEAPAVTDPPATQPPATEAPAATQPPATQAPTAETPVNEPEAAVSDSDTV